MAKRDGIAAAGRIAVGIVFLFAAATKLGSSHVGQHGFLQGAAAFADTMMAHRVIPQSLTLFVAWCVVVAEIGIGAWLLSHRGPRQAALCACAVLALFTAYLAAAHLRADNPECGCFGVVSSKSLAWSAARNGILIGLALPSLFDHGRFVRPISV